MIVKLLYYGHFHQAVFQIDFLSHDKDIQQVAPSQRFNSAQNSRKSEGVRFYEKHCDFDPLCRPTMKRNYRLVPDELQKTISATYQATGNTKSYAALAIEFAIPRATVQKIVERGRKWGVELCRPRGHRPRSLTDKEEAKICRAVDANPTITNLALAKSTGFKVCPRTISNILKRPGLPYTTKRFSDQEPEQLTDAWRSKVLHFLTARLARIPFRDRIYGDESFLYANEALPRGRSIRGTKLFRTRSYYAVKYTLHAYVTLDGPIWWQLCKANANDEEIQRISREVVKRVGGRKYLFWDQLGRSGRCLNPVKQHWNPSVISRFEDAGVECVLLPPKGKYLNPIELLFNDLKHFVRLNSSAKGPKMTLRQLRILVNKYMRSVTSEKMKGFFSLRANGKELFDLKILTK